MATSRQVYDFQNAMWLWNRHHVHDLLGDIRVDGVWGTMTKKVGLRSAYYLGVGQPTIRAWANHWPDNAIFEMTDWWLHPSHFYSTHRFASAVSKARIAAERARRVVPPSNGLVTFDGVRVAGWVAAELQHARGHGWQGTIPDKTYGGYRTYAQQAGLYQDYLNGGGIAAAPGTSRHEFIDWDGGAADCSDTDQLQGILSNLGSDLRQNAPDADPVHFSSLHYHLRTGSF